MKLFLRRPMPANRHDRCGGYDDWDRGWRNRLSATRKVSTEIFVSIWTRNSWPDCGFFGRDLSRESTSTRPGCRPEKRDNRALGGA